MRHAACSMRPQRSIVRRCARRLPMGQEPPPEDGTIYIRNALLLYERNDLDAALDHAQQGLALVRRSGEMKTLFPSAPGERCRSLSGMRLRPVEVMNGRALLLDALPSALEQADRRGFVDKDMPMAALLRRTAASVVAPGLDALLNAFPPALVEQSNPNSAHVQA